MSDNPRLIGTALDEDGDAITVSTYDDGTVEIGETLGVNFSAGERAFTQLTAAEATVLARLLLAAGDVIEG